MGTTIVFRTSGFVCFHLQTPSGPHPRPTFKLRRVIVRASGGALGNLANWNRTSALNLHLTSPHRPVLLHPHLGIGRAPDFAIGVERGDPDQIVLRPVVDHGEREALSPVDDGHGQRRIEPQ